MHIILTSIIGILVLSVVVFIHELGHYLAARWRHIKVDVFSIGFGPMLTSWHDRAGTRWQISLLPLGGYVRLHGFESSDEEAVDDADSFHNKPVLSRALVTVMGPVFNFILTVVILTGLSTFSGRPEIQPDVQEIVANGAAQKAGFQVGDQINALNGRKTLGVADIMDQIAHHPGEEMSIGVLRNGQPLTLSAVVGEHEQDGHKIGQLGVGFKVSRAKPVPFYKAVPLAFEQTWNLCTQVMQSIWQILSGQRSAKQLSGTLGIIHASGEIAQYGIVSLLSFTAAISTSLGLFNLFPIPMLDGGHLIFYAVEAIRGRPVPERAQNYALQAGVILVLFLFLFTFYNDLAKFGAIRWLWNGFQLLFSYL